jgi:N utilization substance protein A
MNYDIVEALSQIAREKGVELRVLVERLEASLLSAAKRKYGANALITVNFDEAEGSIEMVITKMVVGRVSDRGLEMTAFDAKAYKPDAAVGDEIVIPLDIAEFGRNAISAAKQVLIQGVREAERERVYDDFHDKVGEMVRGVVQQVDRGTIVLKLDTAEAVIPAREVLHRDRFRQREMVRALVIDVDKEAKGPQIILSRAHPDFLLKLFTAEVPEIEERIVEIKAVAREAGHRSKIAVYSHDERVDAVGACVGIKGTRVQSIVKELGGERIDIVPWSADPVVFVGRSLAPAKAVDAKADPETHSVTVIVPDDQLSLAIGKQGQNVRLAAKLTGWKIELHSETEWAARTAVERADVAAEDLEGMTPELLATLHGAGIETATDIERKGLESLTALDGIEVPAAEQLYGVALEALAVAREQAALEAAQAAQEGAEEWIEEGEEPGFDPAHAEAIFGEGELPAGEEPEADESAEATAEETEETEESPSAEADGDEGDGDTAVAEEEEVPVTVEATAGTAAGTPAAEETAETGETGDADSEAEVEDGDEATRRSGADSQG